MGDKECGVGWGEGGERMQGKKGKKTLLWFELTNPCFKSLFGLPFFA